MKILTIGFTKKSAETFFTRLKSAGVQRIVDVRLNNVSQLAGFAKKEDLRYFARTICSIEYVHAPELAPTQEMLDAYKKRKGDWNLYQQDGTRKITQILFSPVSFGVLMRRISRVANIAFGSGDKRRPGDRRTAC